VTVIDTSALIDSLSCRWSGYDVLKRHLDEHAIPVRARAMVNARRDLQGLHDVEERQDRQDQKGREAVVPKVVDRVAV
jgi:hypothetical protein